MSIFKKKQYGNSKTTKCFTFMAAIHEIRVAATLEYMRVVMGFVIVLFFYFCSVSGDESVGAFFRDWQCR